jgi:hypothetical protein
MTSFRWLFGLLTAILLAGWITLAVIGGNFRRSFGASSTGPLLTLVPALFLALILVSMLWPGQRTLLHITAAGAALALLGAMAIFRETATTAILIAGYLVCWLAWYWNIIRGPVAHG